jgi:hypothetical protein
MDKGNPTYNVHRAMGGNGQKARKNAGNHMKDSSVPFLLCSGLFVIKVNEKTKSKNKQILL